MLTQRMHLTHFEASRMSVQLVFHSNGSKYFLKGCVVMFSSLHSCCSLQFSLRTHERQFWSCCAMSSCKFIRRASITRAERVLISMPSSTVVLHAGARRSYPFISTRQMRQAPISLYSFKKQRVGISIPALLAA